jgi:hypothetical protein
MKSTWILTAAIGAAVCFGFAQQASKQVSQQSNKPTSKKAELESEGFRFPDHQTDAVYSKNLARVLEGPHANLPYHLDVADMQTPLRKVRTPKDAAVTDLINGERGMFSRAPMRTYEYVATLGNSPNYHLVIYRTANTYGDDLYPVSCYVATLDHKGHLITSRRIAALNSPLSVRTATIYPDGKIVCNDIKQT